MQTKRQMNSKTVFDDKDIVSDSDTIMLVDDVDDLFASNEVISAQQRYITYIKNSKRFARLCLNPEHALGHVDVLLTRGSLEALLPGVDFKLGDAEVYARIRMRDSCPMAQALLLPVGHIVTKLFVGCFGAMQAPGIHCIVDGCKTMKMNVAMVAFDPRGSKKDTVFTITISLAEEDNVVVDEFDYVRPSDEEDEIYKELGPADDFYDKLDELYPIGDADNRLERGRAKTQ